MSYYSTCKSHFKDIQQYSKSIKIKSLRSINREKQVNNKNSLQLLKLIGRSCKIEKNQTNWEQSNKMEHFNTWKNELIEKYDVRNLLDMYDQQVNEEEWNLYTSLDDKEAQVEALLNYERYRSILENIRLNKSEELHLVEVDQIIAAKLVKMNHLTEAIEIKKLAKASSSDSEDNENLFDSDSEIDNKIDDSKTMESISKIANDEYYIPSYIKIRHFDFDNELRSKMNNLSRQNAIEDFNANRKQRKLDRNYVPKYNNIIFNDISRSRSRSYSPVSKYDEQKPVSNKVFVTNFSLSNEVPDSSKQFNQSKSNINNFPIEPSENLMADFFPDMEILDPRHERIYYQTNEHRLMPSNTSLSIIQNRRSRSRSPIKNAKIMTPINKTTTVLPKVSVKPMMTMAEKLKKKMEDAINKRQENDQKSHMRK